MKNINIYRLDLNLLVAFDAIYREGTVTGASKKLHVTQSALSHSLNRARECFGDPLFKREGNRMEPTAKARSMIVPVQTALGILERSVNQAAPLEQTHRKLRIGMVRIDEACFLPQLIARQQEHLDYEVAISKYEMGKFEAHLAEGKFDLAIEPLALHSEQVRHRFLTQESLAIMARHDHPAIGDAMDLDMETFMAQRHVVVSPGNVSVDLVDMAFQRLRLNRKIQAHCHDYWTACKIVETTDCLLTAPRIAIQPILESFPQIRVLRQPQDLKIPEAMDIFLYWHASADQDPANIWLRENIQDIYRERQLAAREWSRSDRPPCA